MKNFLFVFLLISNSAFSQGYYQPENSQDSQGQTVFQGLDQKILKKVEPYRQIVDFSHVDPITQQETPFPTNPVYAYDYAGNISRNGDIYYLWEDNTKVNRNGERVLTKIETEQPVLPRYSGKTYRNFQDWLNAKFYVEPTMQKNYVFNTQNLEILDYTNIDYNTGIRYQNRYFPIYSYVYYGTYTNNGIRRYVWLKTRPDFNGKPIYQLIYTKDKAIPKHTGSKVYQNSAQWYYDKFGTNR